MARLVSARCSGRRQLPAPTDPRRLDDALLAQIPRPFRVIDARDQQPAPRRRHLRPGGHDAIEPLLVRVTGVRDDDRLTLGRAASFGADSTGIGSGTTVPPSGSTSRNDGSMVSPTGARTRARLNCRRSSQCSTANSRPFRLTRAGVSKRIPTRPWLRRGCSIAACDVAYRIARGRWRLTPRRAAPRRTIAWNRSMVSIDLHTCRLIGQGSEKSPRDHHSVHADLAKRAHQRSIRASVTLSGSRDDIHDVHSTGVK